MNREMFELYDLLKESIAAPKTPCMTTETLSWMLRASIDLTFDVGSELLRACLAIPL